MLRKSFALRQAVKNRPVGVHYPVSEGTFELVDVKEDITNKEGKVVRSIITQRRKYTPVNEDEFFHRGEIDENYSIVALQQAGVELQRVTTPYERLSLQDKSDYADYLDMVAKADLVSSTPSRPVAPVAQSESNVSSTQNV